MTVAQVRKWLAIDPFAMAAVLGVHVSSIYRWEKTRTPKIDPLQATILGELAARTLDKRLGKDLGKRITDSLVSRGNLAGLHTLLQFIVEGES